MKRLILYALLILSLSAQANGSTGNFPSNFFKITLSASSIKPGQTLTVFIDSANRLKQVKLVLLKQKLPMYHMWHKDHQHLFRAFAGIPVGTRPGNYKVRVNAIDINNEPISIYTMLNITPAHYKIQQINLSPKKTKLLDSKQLREEGAILSVQFKKQDQKVYFVSPFRKPAKGRISSEFGLRRKYNGHAISTYHKGLDIANHRGTPVQAANGGRITTATTFKSHGKTIMINHGHGIVSVYIHLNEIQVKKGEWVKRGQLIGKIGSSGIATGPHLHFGISVNDIRIDPKQWIRNRVKLHY